MGKKYYKGFNRDMTCRGFKFEEGKEYTEETAELCHSGFHACENPLDTFGYYAPGSSVYHEVELDGVSNERGDDSKVCAKTIRVGARLDAYGICSAHLEYLRAHCKRVKGRVAGDRQIALYGCGGIVSAGKCGAASTGNFGVASAGSYGSANAGDFGCVSAGYRGSVSAGINGVASVGDMGIASVCNNGIASAGNCGFASAGYGGIASAGNKGSASAGECGIACCRGGKVMGKLGAVIAACEVGAYGHTISVAAAIVDGQNIKPDCWYEVKNGKFVEVKDNG